MSSTDVRLALFDLDRTLIAVDSARLYANWRRKRGRGSTWEVARVAFWMAKYTFGLLDVPGIATNVAVRFRGESEAELLADCELWYHQLVRPTIVVQARDRIDYHRARGDLLAIVTSSTKYVALPLARELMIPHVVCTELEVDPQGLLTGRIIEPICFGIGKLERAASWAEAQRSDLGWATFYTDSILDRPLLEAVGEPVAVNPDPRLRRLARSRRWSIVSWT